MKYFFVMIGLCLSPFLFQEQAWSHGQSDHEHSPKIDLSVLDVALQKGEISTLEAERQLNQAIHHSLEEAHGPRIKRWISAFNFAALFRKARRWVDHGNSQPAFREVVKDLVFMYSVSHPTEIVAGHALAGSAAAQGLNNLENAMEAIFGILITFPGFDPLCIALGTTYFAVKLPNALGGARPVKWLVHTARVVTVKSLDFLTWGLGIQWATQRIFERGDVLNQLLKKVLTVPSGRYHWKVAPALTDRARFRLSDAVEIELMRSRNGGAYLSEVFLLKDPTTPLETKELSRELSLFGSNIKDAAFKTLSGRPPLDWISSVTTDATGTRFVFKEEAIRRMAGIHLKGHGPRGAGCELAFTSAF